MGYVYITCLPTRRYGERASRMTPSDSSETFYLSLLSGLLRPPFVMSDPTLCLSQQLDFEYCSKRLTREGIRFFTVSFLELRNAVDQSFETGELVIPRSFGRYKTSKLPAFLISHFQRIYTLDGRLQARVYVNSIKHVRQVLSAFYKLEFPFGPLLEREALDRFVSNEVRIRTFLNNESLWSTPNDLEVISGAALLVKYAFEGFDSADIKPRHGPGKVATGEVGDDKWRPRHKYTRLHEKFQYYRYLYHNTSQLGDLANEYRLLTLEAGGKTVEPVSKIALVPKDSRGPRIIALEPLEVQFIQQGMRIAMTTWLESHVPTAGFVNFMDQTVNQRLALQSSVSREWATIDMKDASDLVSVDLVKLVFRLQPALLERLLACRTQFTRFPNQEEMRLKKFAGMGAATCFPVEALVFWSISVTAIARALGLDLLEASRLCYVYGDDIICPTNTYSEVVQALTDAGLLVNKNKSFVRGYFRESCGVDAFYGTNVTPTKLSKLFPVDRSEGVAYAAWVSYANAFEAKGYTHVAFTIFGALEKLFGPVPYGTDLSPFPCRIVSDPSKAEELNSQFLKRRVSKRYQRVEFYVTYIKSPKHDTNLDGWARLNRDLLMGTGDDPSIFTLPGEAKAFSGWMAV